MSFKALRVSDLSGQFIASVQEQNFDDLPPGDVLIRVHHSNLNYKDALSCYGHKGITRQYPHTPGVDAFGVVIDSTCNRFVAQQKVAVMGYDLGMNTAGGFAEYIRVPTDWVIPLSDEVNLRKAALLGTAALTVSIALSKLLHLNLSPENGPIAITGPTGAVGSIAVRLFSKLGFQVHAITGKMQHLEWLKSLGAHEVLNREQVLISQKKALLKPCWAAAFDTLGGASLVELLKQLHPGASVACCGMAMGGDLPSASVFPFILRGNNLLGVDSTEQAQPIKAQLWNRLMSDWLIPAEELLTAEIGLEAIPEHLSHILNGQAKGRVLVSI